MNCEEEQILIEGYLLQRREQYKDHRWVREELDKWLEELRSPGKPAKNSR